MSERCSRCGEVQAGLQDGCAISGCPMPSAQFRQPALNKDQVAISVECAEQAANYAHDAKVRNQREIDSGQVGGTEGFTYKCRDAAEKCHNELQQALSSVKDSK